MIKVLHYEDLAVFERKLNEIGQNCIISTHVGADSQGWWAVVVYSDVKPKPLMLSSDNDVSFYGR